MKTRSLILSAALVTPMMTNVAIAEPVVFGKANLSLASLDDGTARSTAVSSHSSRVGIKGKLPTDNSLEVTYRFVWQIDMSDDAKSSDDHIKSREQYVGLKDSWGEIRIGRHDTPYKKAGKKNVEMFSDSFADWNNIITKDHDIRADSSVSYYNTFGPAKMSVMYSGGDDTPTADNLGEIASAAVDMEFDNLALALAYQDIDATGTAAKVVLGFGLGDTRIGLAAENIEPEVSGSNKVNAMISAKHKINKQYKLKFAYGVAEAAAGTKDPTMTAIGVDYAANSSTTFFAYIADGADGGLSADAKLAGDATVVAVGVVAKF